MVTSRNLKLFVSAGDSSSDIHCAHLIEELKKKTESKGISIESFGLGGDSLVKAGAQLLMHNKEFNMGGGPIEVLSGIPKRRRLEKKLEDILLKEKVDGAILVDNGEINLRLASLLNFFDVPVVYFIPPKVWVWRKYRLQVIADHVKKVLGILPFEKNIYDEWGIPFEYVGNPLIDEIDSSAKLSQKEAQEKLGLDTSKKYISVFFGSRFAEIKNHVEVFSKALQLFYAKLPESERPELLVPVASNIDKEILQTQVQKYFPKAVCVKGQSHLVLKASHVGLVKSGTSTLEAALLGVPIVLAYQVAKSSIWVYRNVVRYKGFIGLVNLFLGKSVVAECALEECLPEKIADELFAIWNEGPKRNEMLSEFKKLKPMLFSDQSPQKRPLESAANACFEVFENAKA